MLLCGTRCAINMLIHNDVQVLVVLSQLDLSAFIKHPWYPPSLMRLPYVVTHGHVAVVTFADIWSHNTRHTPSMPDTHFAVQVVHSNPKFHKS